VGFLTSRGYRAAKARTASARAIRDELLIGELRVVHEQNFSVYGVKKMHVAMKRRGWAIGREQTRRLMKKAGLRGVQRGKPIFTTIADPAAVRPADLVDRKFAAAAPNRLWVVDITFVRTWAGFCYTACVTDACTRAIVGWAVAATMRTEDLPLQAFNHAVWQQNSDLSELDASFRPRIPVPIAGLYRPANRAGDRPSVGSRGDSYDNALADPWTSSGLTSARKATGGCGGFAQRWSDPGWAVEGAAGVGAPLTQRLHADGIAVTDRARQSRGPRRVLSSGHGRKTDEADAISVGIAALTATRQQTASVDAALTALRAVVEHRDDLVKPAPKQSTRCTSC
jgi:transposase InsO family protein